MIGAMTPRLRFGLTLLRIGVAAIMAIHGIARVSLGIVDDFGVVLDRWGFPGGMVLAWTITIVEIVGGAALAAGYLVSLVACWFIGQLAAGIYLIHAQAGWFVVGAGRNGTEFSALLIVCLVVILLTAQGGYTLARRSR
jgi:putative oxidoreductase